MKTSKFYSIFFVTSLFLFTIGDFANLVSAHLKKDDTQQQANIIATNYIDWRKAYPIDTPTNNRTSLVSPPYKAVKNLSPIEKIKSILTKIDEKGKTYAPFRMTFIEIGHYINRITGCNTFLQLDNLIRFDNGYFGYITPEKDSFEEDGKRVAEFANWLKSQGIKFGYVLCPSKFSKYKNELPKGMVDYSNENADSLLSVLYKHNLPILDLRIDLNKEFANHFDAFFKTDHHWKPETGFWAACKIVKFLNEKLCLNLNTSILAKENFKTQIYPKQFLGSEGKKVSLSMAEPEDFSVITPKFETDFSYEAYCRDEKRNGKFEDSLLNKKNLIKDYYNINTYGTYLGSDGPVVRIINKKTSSNTKLLFIKDSFVCVTIPFIACAVKEIVLVDVRDGQGKIFDGSIKKLIKAEKPEAVILSYNADHFNPDLRARYQISTFF